MGTGYTRNDSSNNIADGNIINASDFDGEFDSIVSAFGTTGHTHDGTTAEGGPIEKLGPAQQVTVTSTAIHPTSADGVALGSASNEFSDVFLADSSVIYFGADQDTTLTHVADTGILLNSTRKIQFNDASQFIQGSSATVLSLGATDEIDFTATLIDINGNADISGSLTLGGTAITATAAELNIIDGDTSASTGVTIATSDQFIINDGGTMKQLTFADLETWVESNIDTGAGLTTVGALDSGSITSGFGNIDTGSSTITTTGLISGGSLDIDDVLINGTTIGHTDDTDLITLADGVVTVAGELDAVSLDVSGNVDIDGTLEADAITVDGTALNEFIADTIGAMVTSNTETGITVTYEDGDNTLDFVIGTLNQDTTGTAAIATAITVTANNSTDETVYPVFVDGATGTQGAETDTGLSYNPSTGLLTTAGVTASGTVTYGSLSDGAITVTAFVDEDNMSSDSATLIPTQQSVKAYVDSSMTSAVTASSTTTLTNKTLTAPKFVDAGFIADANGNEQVVFQTTASAVNALEVTNSATGDAITVGAFGSDTNVGINLTPKGNGVVAITSENLSYAGTAITTTGAEINLIDGDTARGTTSVASGDGILINDAGTMRMTNVDTVSTYFSSHSVGGGNIVTTGALDAGSITSGFGAIDNGASAITTTGLISGGSLDIDNVLINGTTIGHTDDTDLMTLTNGVLTVAGEVSMTTLDIGGTNVTATAAQLNHVAGVTSAIQTQLDTKASTGKSIAMAMIFG